MFLFFAFSLLLVPPVFFFLRPLAAPNPSLSSRPAPHKKPILEVLSRLVLSRRYERIHDHAYMLTSMLTCLHACHKLTAIAAVNPTHYRVVPAAGLETLKRMSPHMKACTPSIRHNAEGDKSGCLPSNTDFMRSSLFLRLLWRPCKSSAATRASLTTLSPSCTGGRSDQQTLDTLVRLVEHIDSDRTGLCSRCNFMCLLQRTCTGQRLNAVTQAPSVALLFARAS